MSVPASSERFLAKARDLAADEVMLDLEDSVAPSAKSLARGLAVEGLRAAATSVAALGFDGKWVLHPAQVAVVNELFTPSAADYERAVAILAAYEKATASEARGAVMLGDEMIDEASRKMAEVIVARGDAAGYARNGKAPE